MACDERCATKAEPWQAEAYTPGSSGLLSFCVQLFPDDAMPGEAISMGGEPAAENVFLADTSAPAGTGEEPALPPPHVRYSSGVPYHHLPIRQRIALDAAVSRQGGAGTQLSLIHI